MNHWEAYLIGFIVILVISAFVVGGILLILLVTKSRSKKWLLKELNQLKSEGLLDEGTLSKIESRYAPVHREHMPPTKIVILIGSILFGIGLIIFIASNWSKIDGIFQLLGTFSLSLLSLGLGYYFKYRNKGPLPILGEGLFLVASLIWGATIIFLFQYFQVAASFNYILAFIWGASIFPLALWFKSEPIFYLSYFLLFLSGIFLGNVKQSPSYLFLLIVIPFLLASENKMHKWIPVSILAVLLPIFCNFEIYALYYLLLGLLFVGFWLTKKEEIYSAFASVTLFFYILTAINKPLFGTYFGHFFFLVPLGILVILAFLKKSVSSLYILLFTLLIGLISQFTNNYSAGVFALSIVKIIMLTGVSYLLAERFVKPGSMRLPLLVVGFIALIIPSFVLSFHELIKSSIEAKPVEGLLFSGAFSPFLYLSIVALLVVVLLVVFRVKTKQTGEKGDNYLFIVIGLSLLGLAIWEILGSGKNSMNAIWPVTFYQNAFLLTSLLLTIFWATKKQLNWLINTTLVLFLLFVIFRYFDLSWKLLDRSVFFIGGGFILLVIGSFMEKLRRKLTSEENHEE